MSAMTSPLPDHPASDQPLTSIGDIGVSQTTVFLPTGRHPVRGSTWLVNDMSRSEEKIATVGIVLAVLFFWVCLLGLLFLLMKERHTQGFIQVTVQGDGFHHGTMIPATSPDTVRQVTEQVNWARSVSAALGS